MYGIQAQEEKQNRNTLFENDVKLYGIQAHSTAALFITVFENDVKLYGIQAVRVSQMSLFGLRMM